MSIATTLSDPEPLRESLDASALRDETEAVLDLLSRLDYPDEMAEQVIAMATSMVETVRGRTDEFSPLDLFMHQYDLSSEEGVLLMCVAEALLRIPDSDTAEALIADKLGDANWESHLGKSDSVFVNASTWGLMLTGRLVNLDKKVQGNFRRGLDRLVQKSGEPVVRLAVRQAMRIMGHQFVMGRTIGEALKRSRNKSNRAYRYSYDMLGEGALTKADAARYLKAYEDAIAALGASHAEGDIFAAPSISVKLSAIHPRYEAPKRERVLAELVPRLRGLALLAKEHGIGLTVDAEEAERLAISLDVFDAVYDDDALGQWEGLGLAVQAYQKRTGDVLAWLAKRAERSGRRIPVRLVKGAYWDSEIKHAQELGLAGYPVYTRKHNTDLSYLVCAQFLLARRDHFYPQFATHNAHTVAAIYHLAGGNQGYEFQRLHGMGEELYDEVVGPRKLDVPCRVYAPVGSHEDLLPYLVRRLLENGANTSFVNRIVDQDLPVSEVVSDPVAAARAAEPKSHPAIALPRYIYGESRLNAYGINLDYRRDLEHLQVAMDAHPPGNWRAEPIVPGDNNAGEQREVRNPADQRRVVGHYTTTSSGQVSQALKNAAEVEIQWAKTAVADRAAILRRAADLLEQRMGQFMALASFEAGKTLPDALAEIREAVDFCRYYANQAERLFGQPQELPGPTGERNVLHMHGRGLFVCISPWNFPLAIYLGQVAAALVSGNPVIAKPAEQTSLIGYYATRLLLEAGIPDKVLQFCPGDGSEVGARLTADESVAGVAFTGSTATAHHINRALAARGGAIPVLIAETGGQNAMIADSSALPEQLVRDVITSAFLSAGQRCSAMRLLFIQESVADRVLTMLAGAMDELRIGDPSQLDTDVGPVIDSAAADMLKSHVNNMRKQGRLIHQAQLPDAAQDGHFIAPTAFEIDSAALLQREVFGPILHVVRFKSRELDKVIDAVNATGYGLTVGVHSRIESTANRIATGIRAGNCYINRNMVGAVVGVQPFGGEGLSGTGPKAGGPNYLLRFASERTVTTNTAAVGGNASLLALE